MLENISRLSGIFIQIVTLFSFMKILLGIECNKLNFKNIITFVGFNIFTMIICNVEYSGIYTLIFFITIIIGLATIYKIDLTKAFFATSIFMIVLFLADIITSSIFVSFVTADELRTEYFLFSNLAVGLITLLIIKIPKVNSSCNEVIKINSEKSTVNTIVFLILLITALSIVVFILSINYSLSFNFFLSVIGIVIFLILAIIFLKEKYEKEKLISKYDQMLEYVTTFEEWMDIESMNIHESKNQLATLRGMILKNKKAVQYIDNIIKERIDVENNVNEKLKFIPKGGLKGLLYYKINIASNNSIKMFIDVSPKVQSKFEVLNSEETKVLCRLIGIFLDNSIEAAKLSEKKIVFCEIYVGDNNLVIAISNTFADIIEIDKLTENGYSTKGQNRGKGLYLAKKAASKYKLFSLENRIINNYYVQKITIKNKTP